MSHPAATPALASQSHLSEGPPPGGPSRFSVRGEGYALLSPSSLLVTTHFLSFAVWIRSIPKANISSA